MSKIDTIALGSSLDLGGLSDGFDQAAEMVDGFLRSTASRLQSIPTGSIKLDVGGSGGSGGNGAEAISGLAVQIQAAFAPVGNQIRQALGSAIQPLAAFAVKFGAQFEQVGPVVRKLAIRIDSAMRFPGTIKRIEGFQRFVRKSFEFTFDNAFNTVERFNPEKAFQPLLDALNNFGGELKASMETVGEEIRKGMAKIKKAIAGPELTYGAKSGKKSKASYAEKSGRNPNPVKRTRDANGRFAPEPEIAPPPPAPPPESMPPPAPAATDLSAATDLVATVKAQVSSREKFRRQLEKLAGSDLLIDNRVIANFKREIGSLGGVWLDTMRDFTTGPATVIRNLIGIGKQFLKLQSYLGNIGSVANATFKSIGKIGGAIGKVSGLKMPKFALDSSQSQVLKGLGGAADHAKNKFQGLIGTVAAAAGIFSVGFVAVDFLKNGIKGASDLNETVSKTRVVMGSAAPAVEAFADTMAKKFGSVKGVTLDAASSFGGLASSVGNLSGDKLSGFSIGFTKLAADLSSFSNIDMKTATEALRTGLSGNESEKLKELGVVYDAETVKQYALAHGITKVGQELTNQQEFMIRSTLITEGLSKVSGDLERTQDGAANQSRKLWGTIENLGTAIGAVLLPAVQGGISVLSDMTSVASTFFENSKETIGSWVDFVVEGFDWVSAVVTHFPDAFEVARLVILEKLTNIGEYIATLGPNIVIIAEYVARNWKELLVDAFNATVTGLQNLWKNFQAVGKALFDWFKNPAGGFHIDWTPMLEGFKATAEKFPELLKPSLTDMSQEIEDAAKPLTEDVARRRAKREEAKAKKDLPVPEKGALPTIPGMDKDKKKKGAAKEDKPFELKFAGASELGTKEAYSSIAKSLGGTSTALEEAAKTRKKTADNTSMLVKEMIGLRRDLNKQNTPPPIGIH